MELSLLGECICSIYSVNSASPLEMHLTLSLLVNLSRRLFAERRHTGRAMERLGDLRDSHSLRSLLTLFANLEDEFR